MSVANASRAARTVALGVLLGLAAIGAQRKPPAQPAKPAPPASAPTSQAQARPTTAAERPVPFKVGETLEYNVSWSSLLTAGTAVLKVQEKRPSYGSTAYYIYAEARPTTLVSRLYSLYYKADTLLDVHTLLPQRGSVYSDENGRRRIKVTRFDQAKRTANYEVRTATVVQQQFPLPPSAYDLVSALVMLRAIPLVEGGRTTLSVADSGSVHTVRVTVGRREQIRTGIGTLSAWRLAPVITDSKGLRVGGNLALWISADARHLPVRLETQVAVGRFVLLLRKATP